MDQTPPQQEQEFIEDLSFKNEDELPGASWLAPEYHHIDKSRDWYWGVGIVAATVTILSFLFGNWLFGLLIIIATFALVVFAHRPPNVIEVHMGSSGIMLDKRIYEFEDLESFWVDTHDNPAHPKILFKSKKMWMPFIIVPLGDMNPDDVADFLAEFLPEEPLQEPFLQRLAEDFGF